MTHLEKNFGIERECCLSIEWVWSIWANAGCHEHRRSNFAFSKCDPYREKFLLTERDISSKVHGYYYEVSIVKMGNGDVYRVHQNEYY